MGMHRKPNLSWLQTDNVFKQTNIIAEPSELYCERLYQIPNQKFTKYDELLLSVMMIESSQLTKTFLENQNSFQCYHNNVGYCKYKEKCRF